MKIKVSIATSPQKHEKKSNYNWYLLRIFIPTDWCSWYQKVAGNLPYNSDPAVGYTNTAMT